MFAWSPLPDLGILCLLACLLAHFPCLHSSQVRATPYRVCLGLDPGVATSCLLPALCVLVHFVFLICTMGVVSVPHLSVLRCVCPLQTPSCRGISELLLESMFTTVLAWVGERVRLELGCRRPLGIWSLCLDIIHTIFSPQSTYCGGA